ncbi:MAG TPA: VCBS domain-containing protein [Leptolyngbyaceae cyanobacterium]
MTSLNEGTLTDSMLLAQQQLQSFAQSENFWSILDSVFGTAYDRAQAEAIQLEWQIGDFSLLPEIQALDSVSMLGILGGYADNVVYLNADFIVNASSNQIGAVLLEEFGHWLDSRINTTDAVGDEGRLFSAVLTSDIGSEQALGILELDDHSVIKLDEEEVPVETNISSSSDPAISSGGLTIRIRQDNGAIGSAVFNGIDYFNPGTPVSNWGLEVNGNFVLVGTMGGGVSSSVTSLSSDTVQVTGTFNGIKFTRTYRVLGETLQVSVKVENLSSSSATVKIFDTFDPDQLNFSQNLDTYSQNFTEGVAKIAQASQGGGYTVLLGTPDPSVSISAGNLFQISNSSDLNYALTFPEDPNGAYLDLGIHAAASRSLGTSQSFDYSYVLAFGSNSATASTNLTNSLLALNGAPVNTVPGTQTISEDSNLVLSGGRRISISDVDAGSNNLQVNLKATNGTLIISGNTNLLTALTGNGTSTINLTGTVANINNALDNLRFTPTANFYGNATVTITTNDLGNTGFGGFRTDTDVINIVVNPVNDAPALTGSKASLIPGAEETAYTITVASLLQGFTDVDGDTLSVSTLTATNGDLVKNGNGTWTFTPNANFNGTVNLTYNVIDGNGGSIAATQSFTLAPVNDPPVIDLNGVAAGTGFSTSFTEDAGAVSIVSPNLSLIDVDSAQVNSAIVRITNLLNAGFEFLAANTAGTSITATYYDNVGILELRGFDSVANYQQVLRSITYNNTSQNPTYGDRSIQFSINDSMANSNQALSTVTVTPVNDAPVIDLNGADTGTGFAATFTEDAGAINIVSSNLALTDVDSSQVNIATVRILNPLDGLAEKLIADAAGTNITVTYYPSTFISVLELRGWDTVANYQKVLQTVKYDNTSQNPTGGDRGIEFSVNDSMANSNQAFATVTVIPVNDAPGLTGTQATLGAGTEDTAYTITVANLLHGFTDVDSATPSVTNVRVNGVALSTNAQGNYVFNPPANANGNFTVTYNVTDGTASTPASLGFSLTSVNDAAVIGDPTVAAAVTEDANPTTLTATGLISIADVDQGEASFKPTVTGLNTNLGTLSLQPNGSYTYSVANSAVQFLGAGQTKTETFTVEALDGTTKEVSFTITGINDAAAIGTPTVTGVTEDAAAPTLTATGSIAIADADQGEASFKSTVTGLDTNLGTLSLQSNGSYTYSVANSAVQFLGAGQTKTEIFTVEALDGTTKEISFTITGANDAAVIGTPNVAAVTEDVGVANSSLIATGSISITDVDQGQASFKSSVTKALGTLGDLTLAANGSYTYSVANSAVQYLGADQTKTETFTVEALDGTTRQVSFVITGVNDAATISGNATASVKEDTNVNNGKLTVGNKLIVSDVDQGEAFFDTAVSFKSNSLNSAALGILNIDTTGNFSYSVDNSKSQIQFLGVGKTITETFTVKSKDGTTSQDIAITINGTNDGPIVAVPSRSTQTTQYSDLVQEVVFSATDPDAGDTLTGSIAYSYNGGAFISGLPDAGSVVGGLGFAFDAASNSWKLGGIADLAAGQYQFRFRATDSQGAFSDTFTALTVNPENARTLFDGQTFVSTDSSGNARVTLRSIIQDVTALGLDSTGGNINRATVSFINRATGAVLASNVPVTLMQQNNQLVGVATFDWNVNIGNVDSDTFTVGTIVNGSFYNQNTPLEDTTVTISKPTGQFISGGGYTILGNSAGQYAGDANSRFNYGFNIKTSKSQNSYQGKFTGIFRRTDVGADGIAGTADDVLRTYQIRSNAADSLVVQAGVNLDNNVLTKEDGVAVFRSKANLTDVTNPLAPVSLGGNLQLEVSVQDFGEPGSSDRINVRLWTGSGIQLLYSNTDIMGSINPLTASQHQLISGGNIDIHAL